MILHGAALPVACAACEAIVLTTQSCLSTDENGLQGVVDGPWWKGGELLGGVLRMLKHVEEELGEARRVLGGAGSERWEQQAVGRRRSGGRGGGRGGRGGRGGVCE